MNLHALCCKHPSEADLPNGIPPRLGECSGGHVHLTGKLEQTDQPTISAIDRDQRPGVED